MRANRTESIALGVTPQAIGPIAMHAARGAAKAPARAAKARRLPIGWVPVLSTFALLVIWDSAVQFFKVPSVVFPAPAGVGMALWQGLVVDRILWPHIAMTLYEALAGFAIGSGVGLFLGVVISEVPLAGVVVHPYVIAFQNIPKVAIAPLFVIWFGFGMGSKIAIAATIAFFPVVINVIAGLRSTEVGRLELIHVFGGSKVSKFLLVKVPTALPYFFASLDIAIVLSITGTIVAEFVGAKQGLGYLIMQYNFTLDMNGIFAALVVLSVMGYALHLLMRYIGWKAMYWDRSNASPAGDKS